MIYSNNWAMKKPIPNGFAVYDHRYERMAYRICLWYLYPFFRMTALIREAKYKFYFWLYTKDLLTTEEGCTIMLRDLKFLKKIGDSKLYKTLSKLFKFFKEKVKHCDHKRNI